MRKSLDPKIWGPDAWRFLNDVVEGADASSRQYCLELFYLLPHILPCKTCRRHAEQYLKSNPPSTTRNLKEWLQNFREEIRRRKKKSILSYFEDLPLLVKFITFLIIVSLLVVALP